VSKPVKTFLAVTIAVAALVLATGGASLARNGGQGTEAAGGGSGPGVVDPAPGGSAGGSGGGSGGKDPEQPCGATVKNGSGPDATVGFTPCPGEEPAAPHPQVVEPTPGMGGVHARPFDDATIGDDDVTVTIDFVSGIEPCSVLDHVGVSYGADAVRITLFEGYDAAAGDVACIDIGVFKRVVITLDQPLGDRTLVDGSVSR
jgi:hypothetical protein